MCACVSDSELVAFLRARHLWDSCCDQLESMDFGLLILLRGSDTDPPLDIKPGSSQITIVRVTLPADSESVYIIWEMNFTFRKKFSVHYQELSFTLLISLSFSLRGRP